MPKYYDPQSYAPILQQGGQEQAKYNSQITGAAGGLPALGGLAQTGAETAIAGQKKQQSLELAKRDYANYLALSPQEQAIPENVKHAQESAAILGMGAPMARAQNVDPGIWSSIQKEGGFTTNAPGTKENVQAGETLARLKGTTREANKQTVADTKQKLGDEKFWSSQFKMFTPTNAARGSLIGQAAFGNARADRALTTLADPKITPQQIAAVVNDYAGIMQGGVPHADSIRAMGFGTLLDDFANLKTRIMSQPQLANQPEVVAKLRTMIQEIKEVDNQIISNNLNTFEATNSSYIERNPEKWQKIRGSVMAGTKEPGQGAPIASPTAQKIGRFSVEAE